MYSPSPFVQVHINKIQCRSSGGVVNVEFKVQECNAAIRRERVSVSLVSDLRDDKRDGADGGIRVKIEALEADPRELGRLKD